MGKILMLYASTTGNTELMAEAMTVWLEHQGHTVITKTFDFDPIYVEELPDYDGVLIGTHTWDDGELPYEVEDFYDELEEEYVAGNVFGVFGAADSFYDTYGGAVDLLTARLKNLGGILIPESLKSDLTPNTEDIRNCEQFAADLAALTANPV